MRFGELRNVGSIEEPDGAQDASGEPANTWAAFVSNWRCEIIPKNTREFFSGERVQADADYMLVGHFRAGVTPAMRVVIDGKRVYEILGITEAYPGGYNTVKEMRLQCRERVQP